MTRLKRILPSALKNYIKGSLPYRTYRFLQLRKMLLHGPRAITIELTDRCNIRCSYCPKGSGIGLDGGDMEFELFKAIVDESIALGVEQIVLVGFGEPLLYPHLIEAIRYVKSNYPSVGTYITTNGVLLDAGMSKTLIDSGLDQITISVNFASEQKYLKLNKADLFERVVGNTRTFLQILNQGNCDRKPKARIQILNELNSSSEITMFRDFWRPFLAPNAMIQVQPFVNWAGQIQTRPERREDEKRYPCTHLRNSWIITREGHALACCMVFPYAQENELVLGSIKSKKSLSTIYSGRKITRMRKDNMNCDYRTMPTCKRCDAYSTVPNIYIRNPLYPCVGRKWL